MAEPSSLDRAIAKLHEILSAVNDGNAALETKCEEIKNGKDARAEFIENFKSGWEDFLQAANAFTQQVDHARDEFNMQNNEDVSAARVSKAKAEMLATAFEDIEPGLKHSIQNVSTQLESAATMLGEVQQSSVEPCVQILQDLHLAGEATSHAFIELGSNMGQQLARVIEIAGEAKLSFDGALVGIQEERVDVASIFDALSEQLAERIPHRLEADLDLLRQDVEHAYNRLPAAVDESVQHLAQRVTTQGSDLAQFILGEAMARLQQASTGEIDTSLAACKQEVAEYSGAIEAAVAATELIEPLIPRLTVAERVLETFNETVEKISDGS